jgi:hypothetical protein
MVTSIIPAIAPAKALRSGAPATTGRRLARVTRTRVSAAVTSEPSRVPASVTGPQQAEVATASAMMMGKPSRVTVAVAGPQQEEAATATSQVLVPRASPQGRGHARPESRPTGTTGRRGPP